MKCPACGNALLEMTMKDIVVDVCQGGCGGVWFDRFELQKVDEPHESAGEDLLHIEHDESLTIDPTQQHTCPKCKDTIMMRHFASVKREVAVDECPQCAGVWLDQGELIKIRTQFASEKERREAAQQAFSELFDTELARMKAESEEKKENAKKVARVLRFICPSYYITY